MYSLPNYHDLDVTPYFAPFFMLFFGLCMGDAGYGIIIFLVSLILHGKLKKEQKPYATLGMFLGGMTIVCGTLTGSFFGIDLSQQDWAFLAPVKKYFINENNFTLFGYSPMMVISVIIGLIQVLLGMVLAGMKAAKLYGWKYGIGKFSWVTALLSAVLLFGLPACGVELSTYVQYIFYGLIGLSALGIFFYNTPNKNPLVNFGTGVWDTYGMATGLLGDLLSYIRLFALGLTGGVLGSVFNSLAIDMTDSLSWGVRWLPMLIILLLGHGINFALCMISSFVHPMRLTFVEFFKNANFEGGGKAYEPFRVKTYKK
jgi:V/A-type H+-transporting ATPase subunit I